MELRRVAVTGIGCVNALGKNISEFWENAKSGQIGIADHTAKSLIGNTLAGSGAIEAIVCLLSMRDSYVHVTAGLKETEEECDLNYVKDSGQSVAVDVAMSNSFGFGGHNSSLIFKKYEEPV